MIFSLLGTPLLHASRLVYLFLAGATRLDHGRLARATIPDGQRILLAHCPDICPDRVRRAEQILGRTGRVRTARISEIGTLVAQWNPAVLIMFGWSTEIHNILQDLHCDSGESRTHVLVVGTADPAQETWEAISALSSGMVDAYFPQSLSLETVEAHIYGLARRSMTGLPDILGDGAQFRIDRTVHRVWVMGRELHLPRNLFHLLYYLALHSDRVISGEQISREMTGGKRTVLPANTLAVRIYRLRRILEQAGGKNWLITVHGIGYRFSPPESQLEALQGTGT